MPIPSLEDIKMELTSEVSNLSLEAMAMATAQLNHNKKHVGFHCFVLSRNELADFLIELEKSKTILSEGTRFQLLLKDTSILPPLVIDHWSSMDVLLKNNELEFILVDAANCLPTLLYLFTTIHSYCPNAQISQLSIMIQADEDNCAYFALSHAWSLSKIIDLHNQVTLCEKKDIGDYNSYKEYVNSIIENTPHIIERLNKEKLMAVLEKVNYISMRSVPKNFGSLFKNTQFLSNFFDSFAPSYLIRNNGQSVFNYIMKHSKQDPCETYGWHLKNKAIQYKKNKIKNRTLLYLQSLSEEKYISILSDRHNASRLFKAPSELLQSFQPLENSAPSNTLNK